MDNISIDILVVALLMFGAMLHGITGLGFTILSTMSVAIIFPLPSAILLVALPNFFINLMTLLPSKTDTQQESLVFLAKKFWLLITSSIVGGLIGVALLKTLPLGWMYLLLSSATLFYVVHTFLGHRKEQFFTQKNAYKSQLSMIFFGVLSGIVGGATNAMSSILMMYLLAVSDNKTEIIKTSNVCFLLAKVVQVALLMDELSELDTKALWSLPVVTLLSIVALFAGIKMRENISIELFKKIVLIILMILSLRSGVNAFTLLF